MIGKKKTSYFYVKASRTANNQMATRIKGALPGKEKAASSSPQTSAAKLKGAVNKTSKPKVSTASAPTKPTKPTPKKPIATDVSKQQSKKPASTASASKPAQPRTKSLDKKPLTPVQKTRVAAAAAAAAVPRSSSLPGRGVASPKPAPGKGVKPVTKEEGKRRVSTSGRNARRSSIGLKKKEAGTSASASATKDQEVTSINHDKVEDLSMYSVPEPEIQIKEVECKCPAEAEEKTVQSLSDTGKSSIDVVVTEVDQEPLCIAKIGDENEPADSKLVISETYPVLEQQEIRIPLDIKTQEVENKDYLQETSSKQELEHDTSKTNSCNKVEKIAGNSHEEAEKEEVKEVAVADKKQEVEAEKKAAAAEKQEVAAEKQEAAAEKQEAATAKKDEAAVVSVADESKEIERPAEEMKKEIPLPPLQQERKHGKIDSPVSNEVIEEAASKLRELRKNKVRALAGAFETVISLQEK